MPKLAVRNGFDAFVARAGGNKPSAAYDAELMRLCEERDLDLDSWRRIGARLQRARARNDALWRKWGRKVAR